MTPGAWRTIHHLDRNANWGDPAKMNYAVVKALDSFCAYLGKKVIIHCGFETRGSGCHPRGIAIDMHVEGMHIVDQFIAASRFDAFNGIGVYLWWNNPGLHVDTRLNRFEHDARWGSVARGEYVALDKAFFEKAVKSR